MAVYNIVSHLVNGTTEGLEKGFMNKFIFQKGVNSYANHRFNFRCQTYAEVHLRSEALKAKSFEITQAKQC